MTATRNGRFKRATLRAVTVAGFAAAAWFAGTAAAYAAEQPETPSAPEAAFGEAHAVTGPAQGAPNTGEDRATPDLVTTLLRVAPELDVQRVVTGVDAVLAVPGNLLARPARPAPDDPDNPFQPVPPGSPGSPGFPGAPRDPAAPPKPHPGPSATCGAHDPLLSLVRQLLQPARRSVVAVAGPALGAVPVGVLPARKSTVVRTAAHPVSAKAVAVRLTTPKSTVGHRPDGGDDSGRTPALGDCAPSTLPASSSPSGGNAPPATLAAVAVLTAPLARALRRAADSALRRAEAPRPTSSPD